MVRGAARCGWEPPHARRRVAAPTLTCVDGGGLLGRSLPGPRGRNRGSLGRVVRRRTACFRRRDRPRSRSGSGFGPHPRRDRGCGRRRDRRPARRARNPAGAGRHASARRNARGRGPAPGRRRPRGRRARLRAAPRLPRSGHGAGRSGRGCAAASRSAMRGCAASRATSARRQEADPRRHRRAHARGLRGRRRAPDRADALGARRGGRVRTGALDLPVLDPGLPRLACDRRRPGRPPHPAPDLVPPRRGTAGRVRVVVRRDPRGRDAARDPRRDRGDERRAPLA